MTNTNTRQRDLASGFLMDQWVVDLFANDGLPKHRRAWILAGLLNHGERIGTSTFSCTLADIEHMVRELYKSRTIRLVLKELAALDYIGYCSTPTGLHITIKITPPRP
jgi:hypothetical protein